MDIKPHNHRKHANCQKDLCVDPAISARFIYADKKEYISKDTSEKNKDFQLQTVSLFWLKQSSSMREISPCLCKF